MTTHNSHTLYLTSGLAGKDGTGKWSVTVGSNAFLEKVNGVVLVHADVPNVFPNVREGEITVTLFAGVTGQSRTNTFVVPEGFYSATTLASVLTTVNDSSNPGVSTVTDTTLGAAPTEPLDYTVSFNGSRFVVTHGAGTTEPIRLSFSANGRSSYTTLARLGFTPSPNYINTTVSTSVTAVSLPNLYGEQIIHISCDTKACSNYTRAGTGTLYDILGTVSLSQTPYGSYATFQASAKDLHDIYFRGQSINFGSRHEMVLLDEEFKQLKLPDHHPVRLTIRCYHSEFDNFN